MLDDIVSVSVPELLGFYDDPLDSERGIHATAINAVAGEEFGLALLLHYLVSVGIRASRVPGPCTTGSRKGHRLDGWVRTPQVLYQVEVKNWSSHSFGGTKLALDPKPDEESAHRIRVWNEYWTGTAFADAAAAKVLEPMRSPLLGMKVEPLIAFWVAMHPQGLADPMFRVPLIGEDFDQVTVFSMSSCLRSLDCEVLELSLPKTLARLNILDRLFSHHGRVRG